jgi:hypothetical protein
LEEGAEGGERGRENGEEWYGGKRAMKLNDIGYFLYLNKTIIDQIDQNGNYDVMIIIVWCYDGW